MIEVAAISPVGTASLPEQMGVHSSPARAQPVSFSAIMMDGIQSVEDKIIRSEALVRQFAIDDSVPLHQVTIALEEARLAVEFAMQFRTRLTECYRELINMQL